jgi:hypothetical protein
MLLSPYGFNLFLVNVKEALAKAQKYIIVKDYTISISGELV